MAKQKKVRSAGRFGSRYGIGIRRKLLKVEDKQKLKYACPSCGSPTVKRMSKGIFFCKKCSHKFTGGAYIPQTLTGAIVNKIVTQKKFLPFMAELIKTTEETKGSAELHGEAAEKHGHERKDKHTKTENEPKPKKAKTEKEKEEKE